MKKLIIFLIFISTVPVYAVTWSEVCTNWSELAETIMIKRQAGISMSDVMNVAIKNNDTMLESIIIEAYDDPRYITKDMQERIIEDFKNKIYLRCAKAYMLHKKKERRKKKK